MILQEKTLIINTFEKVITHLTNYNPELEDKGTNQRFICNLIREEFPYKDTEERFKCVMAYLYQQEPSKTVNTAFTKHPLWDGHFIWWYSRHPITDENMVKEAIKQRILFLMYLIAKLKE